LKPHSTRRSIRTNAVWWRAGLSVRVRGRTGSAHSAAPPSKHTSRFPGRLRLPFCIGRRAR
jgi:hypothetical protein